MLLLTRYSTRLARLSKLPSSKLSTFTTQTLLTSSTSSSSVLLRHASNTPNTPNTTLTDDAKSPSCVEEKSTATTDIILSNADVESSKKVADDAEDETTRRLEEAPSQLPEEAKQEFSGKLNFNYGNASSSSEDPTEYSEDDYDYMFGDGSNASSLPKYAEENLNELAGDETFETEEDSAADIAAIFEDVGEEDVDESMTEEEAEEADERLDVAAYIRHFERTKRYEPIPHVARPYLRKQPRTAEDEKDDILRNGAGKFLVRFPSYTTDWSILQPWVNGLPPLSPKEVSRKVQRDVLESEGGCYESSFGDWPKLNAAQEGKFKAAGFTAKTLADADLTMSANETMTPAMKTEMRRRIFEAAGILPPTPVKNKHPKERLYGRWKPVDQDETIRTAFRQ